MTNEQAKKMLKAKLECLKHETSGMYSDCNRCNCDECSLNYEQGNMGEQKEALDMAIEALEQQTCEDCIIRQAAIEVAKQYWYKPDIAGALAELPSVTLQPNTGHWIIRDDLATVRYYQCSECNEIDLEDSDYCPNCGAKMVEPQESEE